MQWQTNTNKNDEICDISYNSLSDSYCIIAAFLNGFTYENILSAVSLPYLNYIPIVGWTSGMFIGIIIGNITNILVYSSLLALFTIFAIVVFIRSKADYYEDVLQRPKAFMNFAMQ